MQLLKRFHCRRVSELTMRNIAEIRACATSPSTLLVTADGLVQSFQASSSQIDGHSGVLKVGRVAWIRTNQTEHFLAWCALQMWPLHPGKRTLKDHSAEVEALPIVSKKVSNVLLSDVSLAQEFALVTDNNAIELAIIDGAIYVAYAFTGDGLLKSIDISLANRTVIFGAKVPPSLALDALTDLHLALRADRSQK